MVALSLGLRFLIAMPMLYHNIVSISSGPCSQPDEATATFATHSLLEQLKADSHCILNNEREPLLFGLKVVAELITGICVIPSIDAAYMPYEIGRKVLPRAGYLALVSAGNWYWGQPRARVVVDHTAAFSGRPSVKAEISSICSVYRRVIRRNPAAQPPTFFELLHIDPTKAPLWPPQSHSFRGASAYDDAKAAIIEAFALQTDQDLTQVAQSYGHRMGTAGDSDAALGAFIKDPAVVGSMELAAVADVLLQDEVRQQYMGLFLPALMGPDLRITWENAKDRKSALESLCPGTYASKKTEL